MATVIFKITNGPNKFDLAVALFQENTAADEISFASLNDKGNKIIILCRITSIERVTRNYESWNIGGYAKVPSHERQFQFTAKFNTQTRNGEFEIKVPD